MEHVYDCTVAGRVFNIGFLRGYLNQEYVFERIEMLINSTKSYFSCDFMRPDVDFPSGCMASKLSSYVI